MMRLLILAFVLLGVVSCSTRMVEPPENLIAKDKFVDILFELAIYNGVKNNTTPAFTTTELQIMPYLYSKYDFDSVQFSQSNLYYASRGDQYLAMFDTVRARIERTEQLLDSLRRPIIDPAKTNEETED
jgi:hypothetical protein